MRISSLGGRHLLIVLGGALLLAACSRRDADSAEQVVCEPLSNNAAVLPLRMSEDPAADGKLRTFVAAIRTIKEDLAQAENLNARACQRIAGDLAGAPVPSDTPSETACALALQQIDRVAGNGPIPIGIAMPVCISDPIELGRCQVRCSAESNDSICEALCAAHAASRGLCRSAQIAVPDLSIRGPEWIKLGQVLARHVPWLIHAHVSLSKRLIAHAQVLAKLGTELPKMLRKPEPLGLACFGLGTANMTQAIARFLALQSSSANLLQRIGVPEAGQAPTSTPPAPHASSGPTPPQPARTPAPTVAPPMVPSLVAPPSASGPPLPGSPPPPPAPAPSNAASGGAR